MYVKVLSSQKVAKWVHPSITPREALVGREVSEQFGCGCRQPDSEPSLLLVHRVCMCPDLAGFSSVKGVSVTMPTA